MLPLPDFDVGARHPDSGRRALMVNGLSAEQLSLQPQHSSVKACIMRVLPELINWLPSYFLK